MCRHFDTETERVPGFAIHFDHIGELGRPGLFHTYLSSFQKDKKGKRRGFHYSMKRR